MDQPQFVEVGVAHGGHDVPVNGSRAVQLGVQAEAL